jgi:hypothetical protein
MTKARAYKGASQEGSLGITFHVLANVRENLGFMTKAKACKGAGQEGSSGVAFHVPANVRECEGMDPTLPNEFPF